MVYEPITNFKDSNGIDLGKKLVTQDYVATVYPSLRGSSAGLIAYPAELYLWGRNNFGQVGDNTTATRSTPRQEFTSDSNWQRISVGTQHAAAIKTDGTLWTWGDNTSGQLGDNTIVHKSTPKQFNISGGIIFGWKQISCGNGHTVALANDGTLWCWGRNSYGQVGDNTTQPRSTPRQISAGATGITGWTQVSAGAFHTVAIRNDGTLWSWGYNYYGVVGDNTSGNLANRLTPRQELTSSTNWRQVNFSSGSYTTSAIKTDGTLWCWGYNAAGQVGDNTILNRSTPRQISAGASRITGWKQTSSSLNNTAAIRTDGTLWVWGRNSYGQVGDNTAGSTIYRSTPIQEFTGSNNWKQVSTGSANTIGLKTNGTLWVWGDNNNGQVGDNTNSGGVLGSNCRSTPRQEFTSSNNWRQIFCGEQTAAAIKFPVGTTYTD
jgi:alpha-tubulin suppressor-like RCC1 family protein